MTDLAEVIVDVPVMQTNHPYTYRVPQDLEANIEPGMRVVVPFGKGNRLVQAFVVSLLSDQADLDLDPGQDLKDIASVMDFKPLLNEELLQLGQYMSQTTYSFQINCYQTMLPAVYRARYNKRIQLLDTEDDNLLYDLFQGKKSIDWQEAEDRGILSHLMKLEKEGQVAVHYLVTDKQNKKKEKYIKASLSPEDYQNILADLPSNAYRQAELLKLLADHPDPLNWQEVRKKHKLTNAQVKTGQDRGWLEVTYKEVFRDPLKGREIKESKPLPLTEEQATAFEAINQSIQDHSHEVFLLEGVTGSGKTEIYLQTIHEVVQKGRGAIVLVPEISLTPQMVERFKSRFGDQVAILHSGLSDNEKYDEWRRIEQGSAKIVVGARSSIFAPIKDLGIIIIDEEHESTYKQEETPRYHARDIAIWRGEYHQAPVVLGSATPSLESRARTLKNVYTLLSLTKRANAQPLPDIDIVDMRQEVSQGNRSSFSLNLQEKIKDRLAKKQQVVLLLNRRGFSSFVMCRDCGFVLECPNCDISQTLHMDTKTMKCHYCGHEEAIPQQCPECGSRSIRYYGTGTQKIEEELGQVFPEARIIRMDVDTTRKKGAHEKLLAKFRNQEADILLGTQMIAKGLDFPNVSLVGVINADTALSLPDFRAPESTFDLLTQVSGRAGRGQVTGQVVIQSYNPDHYAIQLAKHHDYESFFKKEMVLRKASQYPPFYFLVRITVSHENEAKASKTMGQIVHFIKPALSDQAIVLGPTPRSIARTHNRYHFQTIIKYKHEDRMQNRLHQLLKASQKQVAQGLFISIDPKPMNFI